MAAAEGGAAETSRLAAAATGTAAAAEGSRAAAATGTAAAAEGSGAAAEELAERGWAAAGLPEAEMEGQSKRQGSETAVAWAAAAAVAAAKRV